MSGKAQHIDAHMLHIQRYRTRSLGGIHDKQKPVSFRKGSCPIQIRHISGEIGGMGQNQCFRVYFHSFFQSFPVKQSLPPLLSSA